MTKKYKILITIIIICLTFMASAGGIWYINKKAVEREKNKTAFATGFVMLDNEQSLVWSEAVDLSPETRASFEGKIKKIQADLALAKERQERLADYNNLAIYQKYLGDYKESYNAYLESLKLESQSRVSWQNFADVLLTVRAYKSAEMAYQRAIGLNKYIPESYVKLADYYKTIKDDKRVEETYKLAIETIKPSSESDTLVLRDYADWLVSKQKYNEAIKILQQLLAKQPNNKAAIEKEIEKLK